MNNRYYRNALSLLVALMLVSFVFLPAHASTQIISPNESNIVKKTYGHHTEFPLEIPKDVDPAKPLSESEMFVIDIPESWLKEKDSSTDPGIIDISLSKTEFDATFSLDAKGQYTPRQSLSREKSVRLKIPMTMYASMNPDPDNVRLSFPTRQFEFLSGDIEPAAVSGSLFPAEELQGNPLVASSEKAYPVTQCAPETCAWRVSFTANQSGITYMTGSITPLTHTYSGQRYQAFQELENYYNNGVAIEVISDYDSSDFPGSPIKIFPVVYNGENSNPVYPWASSGNPEQLGGSGSYIPATTGTLPQSYEWYIRVNTGASLGLYQIWLKDVRNDDWYYYDYNDAVNPATQLLTGEGSSELGTIPLGPITLYARTQVRNDWCMIGEDWKHPDEVFGSTGSFDFRSPDGVNWPPYVWIGINWDNRAWNVFPMVDIPA